MKQGHVGVFTIIMLSLNIPILPFLLQNKLTQLRVCQKDGTTLDKGQEEAITKIKDVDIQLELVKDLQKQFAGVQSEVGVVYI